MVQLTGHLGDVGALSHRGVGSTPSMNLPNEFYYRIFGLINAKNYCTELRPFVVQLTDIVHKSEI